MHEPEQGEGDPLLGGAVKAVIAALERNDQQTAIRIAREALGKGLQHPLLLNLRAFWLEQQNDLPAAFADLKRAHELAPDDVPVLNALGLMYARLKHPVDATRTFEKAVALQPDFAPARFNHGWASEMWGEIDGARRSYAKAIELYSGHPGALDPMARMAALAMRNGEWDEARARAEQALAISPTHPMALLVLASAETEAGIYDKAESLLRRILNAPSLPSLERYFAMGALGDLRHAQQRYAEAFNIYLEGNEAFRRSCAGEYGVGESALDALRWMRRYFEELPQTPNISGFDDDGTGPKHHVFLVGFIRSGTTLLEQVLASHPDVVTMEEKEVFGDSTKFAASPQEMDRLRSLGSEERARYALAYWSRVREQGVDPGTGVFIDKQPFNALKLPIIAALFPRAKIILAVRDPRDVILSCLRHRLTIGALTYQLLNLQSAARFYADYMLVVQLMASTLPLALHRVRHEDVVSDFDGEVGKVCDFLGIGWSDSMRDFAERRRVRSISSPSAAQIAKGLNSEGVGQWRRYSAQLAPILPILGPWVEHFGYPPE